MGILSGGRIYGYGRGLNFRKSQGERLRFKVLHKIQDYKKAVWSTDVRWMRPL